MVVNAWIHMYTHPFHPFSSFEKDLNLFSEICDAVPNIQMNLQEGQEANSCSSNEDMYNNQGGFSDVLVLCKNINAL